MVIIALYVAYIYSNKGAIPLTDTP